MQLGQSGRAHRCLRHSDFLQCLHSETAWAAKCRKSIVLGSSWSLFTAKFSGYLRNNATKTPTVPLRKRTPRELFTTFIHYEYTAFPYSLGHCRQNRTRSSVKYKATGWSHSGQPTKSWQQRDTGSTPEIPAPHPNPPQSWMIQFQCDAVQSVLPARLLQKLRIAGSMSVCISCVFPDWLFPLH